MQVQSHTEEETFLAGSRRARTSEWLMQNDSSERNGRRSERQQGQVPSQERWKPTESPELSDHKTWLPTGNADFGFWVGLRQGANRRSMSEGWCGLWKIKPPAQTWGMDLETQGWGAARYKALATVLQDPVSGGQAGTPGVPTMGFLSSQHSSPSPSSSLAEYLTTRVNNLSLMLPGFIILSVHSFPILEFWIHQ